MNHLGSQTIGRQATTLKVTKRKRDNTNITFLKIPEFIQGFFGYSIANVKILPLVLSQ